MNVPLVPLLVAFGGLAIYGLLDGKLSEAGRLAYFVGLLVLVAGLAGAEFFRVG